MKGRDGARQGSGTGNRRLNSQRRRRGRRVVSSDTEPNDSDPSEVQGERADVVDSDSRQNRRQRHRPGVGSASGVGEPVSATLAPARRGRSRNGTAQKLPQRGGLLDMCESSDSDGAALPATRSRASDAEFARLASEEAAVIAARAAMDALQAQLNPAAVEEDKCCSAREEQLQRDLGRLRAREVEVAAAREVLLDSRFQRLTQAMATINAKLSLVYRFLTGDLGDAYCSFTHERRLLFAHGVTLNVRPDQHRWRPLGSLSGGQQALASLALSFAIQAALPSPFYFFDEVDAALDTLNASRVAEYIARGGQLPSQLTKLAPTTNGASMWRSKGSTRVDTAVGGGEGGAGGRAGEAVVKLEEGMQGQGMDGKPAQYIVVSHRPQVFERAGCVIGVYTLDGSSRAVVAHFTPEQ
ncbi:P-loop containing nucleoside triphosphate hydrolase protein [Haematococcus lacustris]